MSQNHAPETPRNAPRFDAHTAAWVLQLAESLMQATEVFGDQAQARDWLVAPHPRLSGTAPIDHLAKPNGSQRVQELLSAERSGIKSRNSGLER